MTTKLDRFQKLQAKVTNDPWDTESWTNLLTEAQQKGNPNVIRETYDQFLKQFPTSVDIFLFLLFLLYLLYYFFFF